MKKLITRHVWYRLNWYRIVIFFTFLILTGIYNVNGQLKVSHDATAKSAKINESPVKLNDSEIINQNVSNISISDEAVMKLDDKAGNPVPKIREAENLSAQDQPKSTVTAKDPSVSDVEKMKSGINEFQENQVLIQTDELITNKIPVRRISDILKSDGAELKVDVPMNTQSPGIQDLTKSSSQDKITSTLPGGAGIISGSEEEQSAVEVIREKAPETISVENNAKAAVESDNSPPKSELAGENLTPYQPGGWDDKIVVSTVTGTNTSASAILTTNTLYVDWSVVNNGTANITTTFYMRLYVDGTLSGTFSKGG